MATRGQPSRVERRSWREHDGPVSAGLLAWRRGFTAVLCAGLLGLFGWLLLWMWRTMEEKSVRWSAATLIIADYDQQSAPPIAFAAEDAQAVESALSVSLERKAGEPQELTGRVATDRQRLDTLVEGLFDGHSGGKGRGLLLYVNAHGCSHGEAAYLLPSDFAAAERPDAGLPVARLLEQLAAHPAAWKVLLIDSGPLARDLRLGTVVNRFPELLAAALEDVKLPEGQRLLVVTSHRTWEASHNSPADRRSVFGYFFEQAIASPSDNADIACPDGGVRNGRVSLAELCRFVQQQTSAWVWQHSAHARTQRPLVLLAQGGRDGQSSVVAVEFAEADDASQPARAGDPAADAVTLLAGVTIARPPIAAQEKSIARRPRWSSHQGIALVQNPSGQPAEAPRDGKEKSSGNAASEPQAEAKQAQPPAEPQAIAPLAERPPAAAPPKPSWPPEWPAWLVALVNPAGDWASADREWTAADYDPAWVRDQLTSVIHHQAAQRGRLHWEADSPRYRQEWLAAARPFAGEPRLIRAVRTRDALLLLLPYFIDAVDRLDDAASARLEQKLAATIDDLQRLCGVLERPTVVDSGAGDKGSADGKQILYERLRPSRDQCDLPELEQCTDALQESYGQVLDELRAAVALPQAGVPASNSSGWLARGELAQAVPWMLIERAASPPPFADTPRLAVINPHRPADPHSAQAKAEPATAAQPVQPAGKALPSELDLNDAVKWAWSRRGRWLQLQTKLANLLGEPAQSPLDEAAAKRFAASEHAAINRHAAAILERHRAAAERQLPLANEPPGNALECWTADRIARLTVVNPRTTAAICPLAAMLPAPRHRLLELSPPRLASAPPDSATAAFQLDRSKPLKIVWDVRSDIPDQLGTVHVEVEYDELDRALDVQREGNQPLRARSPFVWDAKEQRLLLLVSALRDVRAEEAGSGGERKALTVRLTTDGRSIEQQAHFRLPGSPYLDVVVAGNPLTLGAGIQPGQPVPPIDFGGGGRLDSDAGRYHLALRPFSRGTTGYGLSLVNRATGARQLQARWHAVSEDGPMQPAHSADLWQSLQRTAQKTPFATVSRKLEPGASWTVPLFEQSMGPAGAPPAAPAPTTAPSFTRGLLCELRDDADPKWSQWIWITARPLHPLRYLQAEARYEAAPSSEAIVATVRAQPIDSIRLPPGETALAGSVWHTPRLVQPEPLQGDLLPPRQLDMVLPIRRRQESGASPLLVMLDIDGYPRAAQFSIRPLADQRAEAKETDVRPGVRLYVLDKPKEGDEGPRQPQADSDLLFNKANKPDKLDCVVHAEFGAMENLAVRLVMDDNEQRPARVFYDDRQIDVSCHKPEEGSPDNLLLSCAVGDLTHEVNLTAYDRSRYVRLRADLIRQTREGAWTPLPSAEPAVKTLVLDLEAPVVVPGPVAERRIEAPNRLYFTFTVRDEFPPAAGGGGIRLEDLRWSLSDDFSKARPLSELLVSTEASGGVERTAGGSLKFHCVLRDPRVTVPAEEVVVYARATDRAGNVSQPTEVVVKEKQAVP